MSETQVPVIQNNALVQITVGTSFIKRMQELMFYIVIDKTEAEIDALTAELNEGKTTFSEDWMTHYFTVMMFLTSVDNAAKEQGFVKHVDESEIANPQDN